MTNNCQAMQLILFAMYLESLILRLITSKHQIFYGCRCDATNWIHENSIDAEFKQLNWFEILNVEINYCLVIIKM